MIKFCFEIQYEKIVCPIKRQGFAWYLLRRFYNITDRNNNTINKTEQIRDGLSIRVIIIVKLDRRISLGIGRDFCEEKNKF